MSIMFFISQQLALFVLIIIIENTKLKWDFNISNLTNSGLLTIEKHYTLTGSRDFLYFKVSKTRNINVATPKCTKKEKKPLQIKDFRLIFNDKKKTAGRYDCINLLFLICLWATKKYFYRFCVWIRTHFWMCYIIIRYSNQRFAKQSYLFSSLFSLIFSLEKSHLFFREERKMKR